MINFVAGAVGVLRAKDLDAEVLVLAENRDGSGRRLEVQRSLSVTEDDRRLGMDTYCLVVESCATHYGGLESWSIHDNVLHLGLTMEAATALGTDRDYRIGLEDRDAVSTVARALNSIIQRDGRDLPTR
jgi:hypothetical protein